MKRIIKIILGLIGALLVLLILAVVGAKLFIDPNDYRDTIAAKVQQQTGRELEIAGKIKLSFFPWLGLKLGAMELGNAKGFADKPFARIEAVEARVKLLPLLKLQTEIDTVLLRGLELNLQRRSDGLSNWDDLAKGGTEAAPKKEKPATEAESQQLDQILKALAIGGIIIEQANVSWDDRQNKQSFSLSHFNFSSDEIRIGAPIPLKLSTQFVSSAPQLEGAVEFSGDITADPLAQRYRIDGMALTSKLNGKVVPGGALEARFGGGVAVDLAAQSLNVAAFTVSTHGLELKLSAEGKQIIDKPSFSGNFTTNEFVPRQLLAGLGIALPEMADPSTLGKAKLSSQFTAGLDSVALTELALKLDETTFGGKASVAKFATPVIRYTLNLDEIDVDRYLPPPSDKPATAPGAAKDQSAPTELPLALLRSLDIDGSFTVGKVKVMNLHTDTIVTTVRATGGKFRVHPLSANMYQGGYSGDIGFDVSGKQPLLSLNEKLSGVQSGPLLKDFMGKEYVTGEAQLAAKMTAQGLEPMDIRKTLNGTGNFKFANGAVNGMNIGHLIRKGYALYKQQPAPKEEKKATDFADLSGSFQVKNGLVSTSDLSARSPLFQVAGKGSADLVSEKLDLRLDTTIVSDIRDASGERMGEMGGEKVPVTIKGTFSEPKFGVDVAGIFEAKAKAEIEKKKAEVKQQVEKKKAEVKQQVDKKVDEEKKKLQKGVEDKLKNMLKF